MHDLIFVPTRQGRLAKESAFEMREPALEKILIPLPLSLKRWGLESAAVIVGAKNLAIKKFDQNERGVGRTLTNFALLGRGI